MIIDVKCYISEIMLIMGFCMEVGRGWIIVLIVVFFVIVNEFGNKEVGVKWIIVD